MLAFVTSFRARAVAHNWDYHVWLLGRALDSMLAQTCDEFCVTLVCHDAPDLPQARHPKVRILTVDFPPPARNNDDMCIDKVLKVSLGAREAITAGPRHVMFVDADDLVSRRIADFVSRNQNAAGWIIESGYQFLHGANFMQRIRSFHHRCGTCAIVRSDLLEFGVEEFYRNSNVCTLVAAGHTRYEEIMAAGGNPLTLLPFAGAVYVQHPDSTSRVHGGAGSRVNCALLKHGLLRRKLSRIKQVVRALPTLRLLTPGLRTEFSVAWGEAVPREFRTEGLPC
ncbi:MAG: hypothetical protein HY650_13495 [Acidobacteria bacterium]|nr:hypothetical protein [Acidobacteriota bacterium]